MVLGWESCEGQIVEELCTRVVGAWALSSALGVWLRWSLHVVHLQDIGGAAAEAAEGLLGDVLR